MSAPPAPTAAPFPPPAGVSNGPAGLRADPAGFWHTVTRRTVDVLLIWGPPLGIPLLVLLAVGVVIRGRVRAARHARLATGARTVEILTPPEVHPQAAQVFWGQMVGLLRPPWQRLLHGQPHLGWELVCTRAGTAIRLWVPGPVPPGLVERAVQAAWPGARTTTRPAIDPLPAGVLATGGRLRLARPDILPLRVDHGADPVRALLAAAADLDDDETATVQILARPVTGHRLTRARHAAARHRGQHTPTPLSHLLDLATPHTGRQPSRSVARRVGPTPPEESAASRAIGAKAVQPRWEATLTYATATATRPAGRAGRRRALRPLQGRAHALASAFSLYAGHNYLHRLTVTDPPGLLAGRRLRRGDLVAVDELAALAHLPADGTMPGLARAGAAAVPPPVGIPTPRTATTTVKPLGDTDAGRPRPVGLAVTDARHHLHVLGATGSGKSTLLATMILNDAVAGRGVAVIDPKGDLIRDIHTRLPAGLGGRLILIDPDQPGPPPCINILDGADPALATDQLLSICRRIWADSWGPRTDDLLRATCLTLLTPAPARVGRTATLVDVARLLTDTAFRRRATAGVTDPILAGFWAWYTQLSDGARAHAAAPVLNKLRTLLLRPFVRAVLAAGPSTVNLTRVLDASGILLVRIPKGTIGDDASAVFGSIVLAKIWQAALARTRRPPGDRPDAAAYLDEAHTFLTLPGGLADILAEARGLHLSLILAHQHLAQLPADLTDAVAANARNKIFFACSPQDAAVLACHTAPTLTAHDLAHLPAFTAAVRLVVAAQPTAAFTVRTRPLPAPRPGRP
ncbi:helicase HerA domain-containing protein [Frankia sp. CiP3]|uniref:helicase HerA domain-containing protein n=1 Tax=Frankia sp. CiP3 TaxID=2880971 RepID=UPI001EF5E398|nr:DUF87 domain-containing protein [Frankia sp. CiP3]